MPQSTKVFGLGDQFAQFKVYIANSPNFSNYPDLDFVNPMSSGEIYAIAQTCGNGWRKVFNVYAKLVFALNAEYWVSLRGIQNWQNFRDKVLLQHASNTSLLFSPPATAELQDKNNHVVHIVMGKAYAKSLNLPHSLTWLDHEFALDRDNKLLVCPYFDYRQLSNIKIIRLVELINSLGHA